MNWSNQRENPGEKTRIREEIDAQVREFLQRGGKIDILATNPRLQGNSVGSVWHMEDVPDVDQ